MDIESRLELIKSPPTEEIVTPDEMKALLETKSRPVHYIGFEISGMPHIGHILVAGKKINDLRKAGIETQVLLADWHTMANNKLGGDWERIIKASKFYRKLFNMYCPGTKVVLGSELYKGNDEYWHDMLRMASRTTMSRATRTLIIQGRSEKDILHVSQYIYPIMQANDIRAMGVDIPHSGMDQRRIHMLAKELFRDMHFNEIVPLHHHLLSSLSEPAKDHIAGMEKEEAVAAIKMSKSKPGSSISILESDEGIKSILKGAWCPEGAVQENPVMELCRYVIFPIMGSFRVERPPKYGGDAEFNSYEELERAYAEKKIHPVDLKGSVAGALASIIKPVRDSFSAKEKEEFEALIKLQN
ncbi:MAG: tyrosine--tRNA ligase [Candidatus Micrarchaeaceae archaeon]